VPEHRPGTPAAFSALESFLWHDFGAGQSDWTTWVTRVLPEQSATAPDTEPDTFSSALHLHTVLRSMQAMNNGLAGGDEVALYAALNRLIGACSLRPRLVAGTLVLVADNPAGPLAHLLLSVLEAFRSGQWPRFKLCRNPECRASYYDASKAAVKTWCLMETCGSRSKMRRLRARLAVNDR
jgi:predicted RNA-binding Zn ribbon-like protein